MNYDLCDIHTIRALLTPQGFTFSKSLGQNFIIDGEVCPAMAGALGAGDKTGVLEIGPGIGVLTKELCKKAKRVVSVELDRRLFGVLDKTLGDYDNFELVEGDIMKLDLGELFKAHFSDCDEVTVCANLPYYITSPVIMLLLQSGLPIKKIVVMVQREAAERLCAEPGTREAGAVTAAVAYYGESEILFDVSRKSFFPAPKVDSAVISITPYHEKKYDIADEKAFFSLIRAAFAQRRKTFINSVSATLGISKSTLAGALESLSLDTNIRSEKLTMEDFVSLYGLLF